MASSRTDKYWNRIKISITVPILLFVFYIFIYIIQVPAGVEDANITLNTYPIMYLILLMFVFSILILVPLLWHSLYRDKQELSRDFPDVKQRHWITIGIVSYFTGGIYPLWYLYARYRRTKNNTATESGTSVTSSSSSDKSNSDLSKETDLADDNQNSSVNKTLNKGDYLRNKAINYFTDKKYDQALVTFNEAKSSYKKALETASQDASSDTGEIKQKLNAVQNKRQETLRQQQQDEIESLRSKLERADALANKNDLEQARDQLIDLKSPLESAEKIATREDINSLKNEIDTLQKRREQRLTEITGRLRSHPIPDKIPRAPTISIEYDKLTNKEPIGGGGNADVTKATLPTPDGELTLAIKEPRMSGTLHTEAIERILKEAETWDKLDGHDHVVGVIDYGSSPIPWIAMEYMNAGHLGDRSGKLDIPQALWISIAVSKGVRHAHRRGVAHLDLKPENVLFLSVEDGWDVPKVADWGLSKHLLDHSKSVEGLSPQYAAPEQFDEDFGSTDDITDIYQLGAVFYELFTGQPPFEGKPAKTMHKVLHDEPAPPSDIADVPDKLDEILLTALAKEKDERYDDILYLRDDLQELFDEW
ncbi:protein kinase domain-containing protein [Halorubrum ezzemoulense]|uniref:protein kinase domain-containing protein n=1 Tax=Halorubrum ezzemoulense TaxID=337243 RepID=UPI0023302FFA|nr:protein kinase [Halorubrum ezzemoulense]MDB2242717.1 protein kinase [Halorubrum ezzemoulense]